METVALTKSEVKLIQQARKNHKFEYPIELNLNNHKIFRNIAMNVHDGNVRSFIALILAHGSIKDGQIESKLALNDIYQCLGVSNSTYKNTVVKNVINSLGNAISCEDVNRSLSVKTYHNR